MTIAKGARVILGIISGAIFIYFTQFGIVVNDEGGTLFAILIFFLALQPKRTAIIVDKL